MVMYVNKRWIPGTITNYTEVTKQYGQIKTKMEVDMKDQKLPKILIKLLNRI